eukprot:11119220-Prorocentrum_lima.AAC.1
MGWSDVLPSCMTDATYNSNLHDFFEPYIEGKYSGSSRKALALRIPEEDLVFFVPYGESSNPAYSN